MLSASLYFRKQHFMICQQQRFYNYLIAIIDQSRIIKQGMMRQTGQQEDMMYKWMQLTNPGIRCQDLHPDSTCFYQVYYKMSRSLLKGFKFYLVLHMIPFLLFKVKKINDSKKLKSQLFLLLKKYIGSLCFMSTLVGGIKLFLCFSDKINIPEPTLQGKVFIWGSLISTLSIFFQDSHRRQEIVYFIFVRAFRSAIIWMKKRKFFSIPSQQKVVFVALITLLSYLYDFKKEILKNSNLLQKIWGIN